MTKEFKVIKIIDRYNILIDAGKESDPNIKNSTIFEVYLPGEEVIIDGKEYGKLDFVKAELEIKQLYPKMTLCQNNKIIKTNPFMNRLASVTAISTIEEVAPLNIDKNSQDEKFKYFGDTEIRVGDLVRIKI